jgi:hypothetical protein
MFKTNKARTAFLATGLSVALVSLLGGAPADAKITQIVIERTSSPAFDGAQFGAAGQYEVIAGRAYGELDPNDERNAIITDIQLAPRNARGMVQYETTFQITKPVDMTKASGLMWHDVPNRGRRLTIIPAERAFGDIGISSGWQGDNSGRTVPGENNDYVIVPVAKNPDGSPITGQVMGRIMNASGPGSQTVYVHSNPMPYEPASLDTSNASLSTHSAETRDGTVTGETSIAASDWAFARCDAANPFPGTPDARQICVRGGFDPSLLYQVVFTAQDPPVLGIGFAAFRDIGSFFKYAEADEMGTPSPIANAVTNTISRGVSQSGNYIRQFLHQGFNEDEAGRRVHDGAWPIVAGRRIALNFRFAMPDGVLKLFEPGIEGTQSWGPSADPVRGIPTAGILDRCEASNTCPKVLEHFGAAEMWGMKVSPAFVGTSADKDIPLPGNVRRYYIGSTAHGGGPGGFNTELMPAPTCPSTGWGVGSLANNPMPHTETVNALRVHFREWVMNDRPPPESMYPTLAAGQLVDPDKESLGFPTIPGLPAHAPTGFINPMIDYDFGESFNHSDGTGIMSNLPPTIKRVIAMKAPKVDADGNELGGVPVVQQEAPLGTYLGWNITADGFFKGQPCNYAGGFVPFANTQAERVANDDPRPSLEERYGDHQGYVDAVRAATTRVAAQDFLLPADVEHLVRQAEASDVLR